MPIGSLIGGFLGRAGGQAAQGEANAAGAQAWEHALEARKGNQSISSPYLAGGWAGQNALLKAFGLGHLTPMDDRVGYDTYGFSRLDDSNAAYDRKNALADFQASPGYQWRLDQGTKALDRSAAAKGGLFSGAQGQAVTDFGQNQASQEWGNYISGLQGLSGQGAGVANATNSANTSALNSGNALDTTAQLKGADYGLQGANAFANGIMNGFKNLTSILGYGGSGGSFGLPGWKA